MGGAIKARYENKVLKPLGEINLKEGEEVEIDLKKKNIFGLLQGWKIDAQSLKDELREINEIRIKFLTGDREFIEMENVEYIK